MKPKNSFDESHRVEVSAKEKFNMYQVLLNTTNIHFMAFFFTFPQFFFHFYAFAASSPVFIIFITEFACLFVVPLPALMYV